MKSFLLITSLILTFCAAGFAQTNETLPCPTLRIVTPDGGYPAPNEKLIFTVTIDASESYLKKLKYNWQFSKIVSFEGQGSPTASVIATEELNGLDVNPNVEIEGLPKNYEAKISESYQILFNPGSPLILDEYTKIPISDEKARIGIVAWQPKETYKDSRAIFNIYYRKQDSKRNIRNRIQKISNLLLQTQITKDRFDFVLIPWDENSTRIIIVPNDVGIQIQSWEEQIEKIKP